MAGSSDDIDLIDKLKNSETFQVWKFQVTVIFKSRGLWDIVNGVKLYSDLTKTEEKEEWVRKDARAQKVIVTTIDKKLMIHVLNCETSKAMFDKICSIFEQGTEKQKCSLLQDFFNYTYQKGTDMSTHIGKLENITYRLQSLGHKIDETMIISKILVTLPEDYKFFSTAWESTHSAERTLTNLTARLLAEETKNKKSNETEGTVAFYSGHPKYNKSKIKCFKCGNMGHMARTCFKNGGGSGSGNNPGNRRPKQCPICKKTNHEEEDCFFRKKGRPEESKNKTAFFVENNEQNLEIEFEKKSLSNFVVDSGATTHMVNNKNILSEIKDYKSEIGIAKKNQKLEAEAVGTVNGEQCILNEVLYVPELSKNLLSVHAVTERDGEVTFKKNKVIVFKNGQKVLEGKKQENGLYTLDLQATKDTIIRNEESMLTEDKIQIVEDWHRKLGHLNKVSMKNLLKLTTGMNITESECDCLEKLCDICIRAKQTRLPFDNTRSRASRPLEIIHTDVCGPIEPCTWDEKKYILTFLDDYTHYSMIYLLSCKYEVTKHVKFYIQEVEAQINYKVSKLRSDNGGEYMNNDLKSWCKNRGIIIDSTIPYTPQLNGRAERLNRTIMDKARSLLFDSGLDKKFWGEAAYVSTYLINRSPTQSIEVTPAEKWFNKKPDLSRLQIFGCDAYAKVLGHLKKLDERSKKYIFIGYGLNGYRLWDNEKKKIVTYRDVVFKKPSKIKTTEIKEDPRVAVEIILEEDQENEELRQEEEEEQVFEEVRPMEEEQEVLPEQRPIREIRKPVRFNDYVLLTYQEAVQGEDKEKWLQAIEEEKRSLSENDTWIYVDKNIVKDKKVLTSKWVFKVKDDGKYKARLVIRGFEQQYGIDFHETFSPVVNMSCLRVLFALAANKEYCMKKFDIKTAFLYGELNEEIFMDVPEGYETKNQVCLLKRSLYGLKQAPLSWNKRFTTFLLKKGLKALKTERCVFKNDTGTIFLAIYVDDGIIVGFNEQEIIDLLSELNKEFQMVACDNPSSFLGIDIFRNREHMVLSQVKYTEKVLKNFCMENSKFVSTPMAENSKFNNENDISNQNFPFRELIGSLLYLTNRTRPDISFPVNVCSRNMEKPTDSDIIDGKRILRYLNGTRCAGICYKKDSNCKELLGYCDSDFAGDIGTRKSTTGYVIFFCGGPITWSSRKQPIVSLSSTESEYIAAAECTKELIYLKSMIEEIISESVSVNLKIDNQSAITLMKTGQFSKRSKHIDVRYHFIHEKINEGLLNVQYCPTDKQLADIFTKALGKIKFEKLKAEIMFEISE